MHSTVKHVVIAQQRPTCMSVRSVPEEHSQAYVRISEDFYSQYAVLRGRPSVLDLARESLSTSLIWLNVVQEVGLSESS